MPSLVALFQQLMQSVEPALMQHLAALGYPAHAVAQRWMATAFVAVLPVHEVLALWDRVVGCDSLVLLPIAAVALLAWRCAPLQACASASEVETVLQHMSCVRIVPLVQGLLFLTAAVE